MSVLFRAYPLLRPALFALEPETAHSLTLSALHALHALGLTRGAPAGRPVSLMGMTLPNGVGLAAGLDKNGDHIDPLGGLGFGFMEIGTVTPKPQPGNPLPRLFRLPRAEGIINRMGFNNDGLDAFLRNVGNSRYRARGGILGLNIGKNGATPIENAVDDYLTCLKAVYPHADYVTINVSSPNTKNLRSLQGADELSVLLRQLVEARDALGAEHGRRVPLAVKIAPDLDDGQIDAIAELLPRLGIDGVIATNTTLSRDAVQGLPHCGEAGGLSGTPVREMSLRVIERLRRQAGPGLAIIGVGGIMEGRHAADKIAAGADAVQIYSGLVYRGPALIDECVQALSEKSPAIS